MIAHDPFPLDISQASGWYAALPPPAPANRLEGKQKADWVVIGAGVTGLGAARRLAELDPGARVILLERHRVGYGASGRNSGFVMDTPHLTDGFDVTHSRRVSRLVTAGLAQLERLVRNHGINCEWSRSGHLNAIVESKWTGKLESLCRTLDSVDKTYEWLERDALANIVGTRHYHAAVFMPNTVLMNPAALCSGLADSMPENVEVFQESPVRRIDPGSPAEIDCAEGSIIARNVLLTTNALTPALGFLRRELCVLSAYVSLSKPLNDVDHAAMSGEIEWGITPAVPMAPTIRRTRSGRILVRHGVWCTDNYLLNYASKRELSAAHEKLVRKRFPMLENLEMEHTWGGVFCMTRRWASFFGRLERGLFACGGYAGIGIARGTISGALLAEFALGSESGLIRDAQALSAPCRLPPEPLLSLGVNARLWWKRLRATAEC
ncbi:MAG: FAD-binding oxidoreductase [Pseudomonadota bacterium]